MIAEMVPGNTLVNEVFFLKKMEVDLKTGNYNLVFSDKTGYINGKMNSGLFKQNYYNFVGRPVKAEKVYVDFDGRPYLRVVGALDEAKTGEYDADKLVKSLTEQEKVVYEGRIECLINSIQSPSVKAFLKVVFNTTTVRKLAELPSTLSKDTCLAGGLLLETVYVTETAVAMAESLELKCAAYAHALPYDKSLIVAAGLLHKIGVIKKYTSEIPFKRTEDGILSCEQSLTESCIRGCVETAAKKGIELEPFFLKKLYSVIDTVYGKNVAGARYAPTKEGAVLAYAVVAFNTVQAYTVAQERSIELETEDSFVYSQCYGGYVERVSRERIGEEENDKTD